MSWEDILKTKKGLSWFMPKMKWDKSVWVNPEREIKNVSVDEVERRLKKDSYYIPPDTTDSISVGKMKRIKEGIDQGVRFPPVILAFDKDGSIGFEDGRHRFAVARELGIKKIPAIMYKETWEGVVKP